MTVGYHQLYHARTPIANGAVDVFSILEQVNIVLFPSMKLLIWRTLFFSFFFFSLFPSIPFSKDCQQEQTFNFLAIYYSAL